MWGKRRLRLAEAAAHRCGLNSTFGSFRETAKVALAHINDASASERVVDAIRASDTDTEEDTREIEGDKAMTRRALDLLGSLRNDRYEAALAALRDHTREWWVDMLARHPDKQGKEPITADEAGLRRFLESEVFTDLQFQTVTFRPIDYEIGEWAASAVNYSRKAGADRN